MNSFGRHLKFTSFGESHGKAIGVVIDNYPSGIKIDYEYINFLLKQRQGGSAFSTPRKEEEKINIISGVFNDISTGAPICVMVENTNIKSKDYDKILRPSHADISYFAKYEIYDYLGGGRSSARESLARVIAGAFADFILKEVNIRTYASLCAVGKISVDGFAFSEEEYINAQKRQINALNHDIMCEAFKDEILKAKANNDSIGSVVSVGAFGVMAGLGEPLYDKLDARIASAFMGFNAVKAVEIGLGSKISTLNASYANEKFEKIYNEKIIKQKSSIFNNNKNSNFISFSKIDKNKNLYLKTRNNFSGGINGGISNGETIYVKSYFKPTPSIFKEQNVFDFDLKLKKHSLVGRHDPCVGVRACVVLKAMMSFILADYLLLNTSAKISNIKKIYKGE
ncbi:chorismate synthase [Campylobacter canadensis]|uniref:Chorismate synthase n=1 Tax=Campylobacter canadensis TaxID=449520 RepID=A0ABS7WNZ4_9BACT|nr:chorismate synthase [Campylobacter canadensis]MBZ7986498.1 chorismate synthase [Campylobacter canadensis]MBZ7997535.1 chorismate synthase [Campylobacter canadensis]